MDTKLFEKLVESVTQMNEIIARKRKAGPKFIINAAQIKAIRQKTGLTQAKFCKLIDVNLGTLRNWEQGRREPTGPAKALLKEIKNDPKHVLSDLAKI